MQAMDKMVLRKRNLNIYGFSGAANKENGIEKRKNTAQIMLNVTEQRQKKIELVELMDEEEDIEVDYDKENKHDLAAVSDYAQDIFAYYKDRERFFKVGNYFTQQSEFTRGTRAILIDWLVEMQETFELNHETLYLAVKLFDIYVSRVPNVSDNRLQLIASACAFISSKFDERNPPLIDDFICITREAFDRDEMIVMEREVFRTIGLDLGIPVSYRFLRRYARVCKSDMETLTLARYILETSLMFFEFCRVSESLMGAASYVLALRMKHLGGWTKTLQTYSGYTKEQVDPLVAALNHMIIKRKIDHANLDTVYKKYAHEIFFKVALIDSLPCSFPLKQAIMPPLDLLV